MNDKLLSKFSSKIGQLLDDDEFDTIIRVGSSSSSLEIKAHSIILKVSSSYFKNSLKNNNMCMSDGNWKYLIDLEKSNISPPVFEVILK